MLLIIEKQRFEEERSTHSAFMTNYSVIKDKLDKSVQDELNAEKKSAQRVAQLREEEDRQINEVSIYIYNCIKIFFIFIIIIRL